MTDTRYTVFDGNSCRVFGSGLTVTEAADEILSYDSRRWELRLNEDSAGWDLWSKGLNDPWRRTALYSLEADYDTAWAEIAGKVIAAGWDRHPDVMTDEDYAAIMRQADEDEDDEQHAKPAA